MMQPVEAGVVEVTELESWLGGEVACEVVHGHEGCSVEVTALGVACVRSVLMCEFGRIVHLERMEKGHLCAACKNYASDCWRIIPI